MSEPKTFVVVQKFEPQLLDRCAAVLNTRAISRLRGPLEILRASEDESDLQLFENVVARVCVQFVLMAICDPSSRFSLAAELRPAKERVWN